MKKSIIATAISLTVFIGAASAQADQYLRINKGISGLLLGAGGGALAGQVIGRNTESTLIGTAVGTMVGYIVGNEMDKYPQPSAPVAYHYQQQPGSYPAYQVQPGYQPAPLSYNYEPIGSCRQVALLGTVQGDAQNLYATACKTERGWELISDSRTGVAPVRPQNSGQRSQYPQYQPASVWQPQWVQY
ncbi:MAG: glycine zipper 2TM domain-containing protein [Desulfocapsaceae bacterium]